MKMLVTVRIEWFVYTAKQTRALPICVVDEKREKNENLHSLRRLCESQSLMR